MDEATKFRGGNLGFLDANGVSDDAPVSVDRAVVEAAKGLHDGAFVEHAVAERGYFGVVWRRATVAAVHRTVDEVAPQIRGALWRERVAKVEAEAVAAPAPEKAEVVVTEPVAAPLPETITTEAVVIADPNKPKKGGWWAKAKASLGGA